MEEISAPLVFQCRSCYRIIGDSLSFVSSDEEMQIFTLQASSNVSRSKDVITSKSGRDAESTFHLLHCAGCSSTIGRVYLTTSEAMHASLNERVNRFTFDSEAVTSYELGKNEYVSEQAGATFPAKADDSNVTGSVMAVSTEQQLQTVQADLTKVQNLMLVMDERIAKLEEG